MIKSELVERKSEKNSKINYLLPTEKENTIISVVPQKLKSAKMIADLEADIFIKNITEFA